MRIGSLLLAAFFSVSASDVHSEAAFRYRTNLAAMSVGNATFDEFDTVLTAAYNLYTQKKYDEALAKSAEAARIRPDDNRPYAIAGLAYMAQWRMKSASDSFAKAIALSPKNEKLHYLKARADRHRNAKEEALVSVRKAIELNPNYAEAYLLLGDVLGIGSSGNKEQIEALRKALELNPKLLEAYRELGMALESDKNEKEAEAIYRKAMEVDGKKAGGRFELGRLLVKQGRLKEARELWDARTTDVDNTFPNFITVLERAEKLERVKADFAAKPDDPDALLQMGLAVMEGDSWVVDGRQEKAIEYFRKALAKRPGFAAAQFAIVKAYIQIADTSKSKNAEVDQELAQLKALDPKLAGEAEAYRKTYSGGLKGFSISKDQ